MNMRANQTVNRIRLLTETYTCPSKRIQIEMLPLNKKAPPVIFPLINKNQKPISLLNKLTDSLNAILNAIKNLFFSRNKTKKFEKKEALPSCFSSIDPRFFSFSLHQFTTATSVTFSKEQDQAITLNFQKVFEKNFSKEQKHDIISHLEETLHKKLSIDSQKQTPFMNFNYNEFLQESLAFSAKVDGTQTKKARFCSI